MKVNKKVENISISEKRSTEMGRRVRQSRKKEGMNQDRLAEFLGKKDRSSISKMENGESNPSIDELLLMAAKFKVQPTWLAAADVFIDSGELNLNHEDVSPILSDLKDAEYQASEKKGIELPEGVSSEDLKSSLKVIRSLLESFDD